MPGEAVLVAETVIVEEPEPVMVAGLNVVAAPLGNPVTLRETLPAKPFDGVIVTV